MSQSAPSWESILLPNVAQPLHHPRGHLIHSTSNTHGPVGPLMRKRVKIARGVYIVDQNCSAEGHGGVNTFLPYDSYGLNFIFFHYILVVRHVQCVSDVDISGRDGNCLSPFSTNRRWSSVIFRIFFPCKVVIIRNSCITSV